MAWRLSAPIRELLSEPRLVVPVVGAGMSVAAGLPSSTMLASYLMSEVQRESRNVAAPHNLFSVADQIYRTSGTPREELNVAISRRLQLSNHPDVKPTRAHRLLTRVQSRIIVTFNYDLLLEQAAQDEGTDYLSITHREAEQLVSQLRTVHRKRLLIYHLHGSVADPDSIVIDDQSYRALCNDLRVTRSLEYVAEFTSMSFMGTRLDEPYIQATLLRLPVDQPRHILVTDASTAAELTTSARSALLPSRYGIVTAAFPTAQWHHLDEFLEYLVAKTPPRRPAPTSRASKPYKNYIEPNLKLSSRSPVSEYVWLAQEAISGPNPEALGLEELCRTWRTVVVGSAGSGKSSLLYRMAEVADPLETPVIVDLTRVTNFTGASDLILKHFLSMGKGARPTIDDSRATRFLILLDRLDEVVPELQAPVAEAVAKVAESFPQHRFIVVSRRIPALKFLTTSFTEYELANSRRWAERYLRSQGRSLHWLQETLPECRYLGLGATNPLILAELYRMAVTRHPSSTELEQPFRVLSILIDRLIRREASRISCPAGILTGAVRRIAALQKLMALDSIDIHSLSSDHEINRILAQRHSETTIADIARTCFVRVSEGEIAGEDSGVMTYLTGKYILNKDKDATIYLPVVAPTLASHSEIEPTGAEDPIDITINVEGARADLSDIASMLVAENAHWANALWKVDPLLVSLCARPEHLTPSPDKRAQVLLTHIRYRGNRKDNLLRVQGSFRIIKDVSERYGWSNMSWIPAPTKALGFLLRYHPLDSILDEVFQMVTSKTEGLGLRIAALAVLNFSGRMPIRLLEQLCDDAEPVMLPELTRGIVSQQRSDLLPALVDRLMRLPPTSQFVVEALDIIRDHCVHATNAQFILNALQELSPSNAGIIYWRLIGIIRMTATVNELLELHRLARGKYSAEFLDYYRAFPLGFLYAMSRLVDAFSKGDRKFTLALMEELTEYMRDIEGNTAGAERVRAMFVVEDEDEDEENEDEDESSMPVLMPSLAMLGTLRRVVQGLESVPIDKELATWLPADASEYIQTRLARVTGHPYKRSDILYEVGARLADMDLEKHWMEVFVSVIPQDAELPALPWSVRAAVGARIEEAVRSLRQESGTTERIEFLGMCGPVLALEPSPSEWIQLVLNGHGGDVDWLASKAPPADAIRESLKDVSIEGLVRILEATPQGVRATIGRDVIAALKRVDSFEDETLGRIGRAFCASRDIESIRRLILSFPNRASILGGWLAALGDDSYLGAALEEIIAPAATGQLEKYSRYSTLEWVEIAAGLALNWPENAVKDLLITLIQLSSTEGSGSKTLAVGEVVGTLLIAISAMKACELIEFMRISMSWTDYQRPVGSLFGLATESAHVSEGVEYARHIERAEGINGRRVFCRYHIDW